MSFSNQLLTVVASNLIGQCSQSKTEKKTKKKPKKITPRGSLKKKPKNNKAKQQRHRRQSPPLGAGRATTTFSLAQQKCPCASVNSPRREQHAPTPQPTAARKKENGPAPPRSLFTTASQTNRMATTHAVPYPGGELDTHDTAPPPLPPWLK